MEDFYIYNLLDKVINSLELLYFDSKTSESVKADEPPKTSQPPLINTTQNTINQIYTAIT